MLARTDALVQDRILQLLQYNSGRDLPFGGGCDESYRLARTQAQQAAAN